MKPAAKRRSTWKSPWAWVGEIFVGGAGSRMLIESQQKFRIRQMAKLRETKQQQGGAKGVW